LADFKLLATDGGARRGVLTTPHGRVDTPAFMPVGTNATVKMATPDRLAETGTAMILGNAYHLALRPGVEVVRHFGGLHRFMGWPGPILTDSGGFQVLSLAMMRRVSDDGVRFQSHIDGSMMFLTPEGAVEIQQGLGADVIMCLDECVPYPVERSAALLAVERTLAWAQRCRAVPPREGQSLFGIVQGSVFADLRVECALRLVEMDFPGYAIGGVSVGEGRDLMNAAVEAAAPHLPQDKPRYLMGVGTPEDILDAVERGIDMFDCVLPTRNARRACAFTRAGRVRLRNLQHRLSDEPLEAGCDCYACRTFTRGYLRHLFMAREGLAAVLTTTHNIRFYQRLMAGIRAAVENREFPEFRAGFSRNYERQT